MLKTLRGNSAHYGIEFSGSEKQTLVQLAGSHYVRPLSGFLTGRPLEILKRLYFDRITFTAATLRYLIDLVGVDRLMLGSDFPFEMGDPEPARASARSCRRKSAPRRSAARCRRSCALSRLAAAAAARPRRSPAIDLRAHVCIENGSSCALNRCTPKRMC